MAKGEASPFPRVDETLVDTVTWAFTGKDLLYGHPLDMGQTDCKLLFTCKSGNY